MRWTLWFVVLSVFAVAVPARAQIVSRDSVIQEATRLVGELCERRGDGLFVAGVVVPGDVTLPDGALAWSLEAEAESLAPGRYTLSL
ncbi:MAG: hypothetical protein HQL57_07885, partial [Magnetococcales bacterium]|nr:hypothetical protein [Magnetococcales bacterium]